MDRIYLDNAASTPLDAEVLDAMLPYLREQYGNPSSIHHHGRQLRAAVEGARKTIAHLLNCSPGEIVFTSGGTEADNYALKSTLATGHIRTIITSPLEHHAVLHTLEHAAEAEHLHLHLLRPDSKGNLDLAELETVLKATANDALISLMHGNNEIGTLNDIHAIGLLARQYGAIFHSDTVQTVGHLPLDMQALQADMIVASAHKFRGPKGVGFLFRREGLELPSLLSGGGQERNQRAGTESVAAIVGMALALGKALNQLEQHRAHLHALKNYLKKGLMATLPGIDFNGETGPDNSLPTVLNVAFPSEDEESLLLFNLDLHGISASGGSACTSGSVTPSHVLQALGHHPARIANSIRFSFGPQNTTEELDTVLAAVRQLFPVGA